MLLNPTFEVVSELSADSIDQNMLKNRWAFFIILDVVLPIPQLGQITGVAAD